jgi:hypothetical protein
MAGEPTVLTSGGDAAPFSRLTLTAQEEVLAHDDDRLRSALDAAHPYLRGCPRGDADWPAAGLSSEPGDALSPSRFARQFLAAMRAASDAPAVSDDAPRRVLAAFLADRLRGDNLYPLLFAPVT